MKKILGIAIIAVAMLGGALVLAQPTQAQEPPPPPAPLLPCDPAAPVFPCTTGDFPGGSYCLHFAFGAVCFTVPAPAGPPPPPEVSGSVPSTTGDPQPWTDGHSDFPPGSPFGPGGE